MTNRFLVQSEPQVERLAIVESDALGDRIPLLVSSNQQLFAQMADESLADFSRRFIQRVVSLPATRVGLLLLGDDGDTECRWRNLLGLASRLQREDGAELIINVRSGSPSEQVGWQLLERASGEAFFRGVRLRLQFGAEKTLTEANTKASPVRLVRRNLDDSATSLSA